MLLGHGMRNRIDGVVGSRLMLVICILEPIYHTFLRGIDFADITVGQQKQTL